MYKKDDVIAVTKVCYRKKPYFSSYDMKFHDERVPYERTQRYEVIEVHNLPPTDKIKEKRQLIRGRLLYNDKYDGGLVGSRITKLFHIHSDGQDRSFKRIKKIGVRK